MAGWYLSEQAREALRSARGLSRGRRAVGSADPLLVAILGQWEDEQAGGPALLRACGMTADQARQLAAILLPPEPAEAAVPEAEPRIIGTLRFVVDQAWRIAAEARAPYVGTEHLVAAILWEDSFIGAHELRRLGISYARAAEQLATLPQRAGRADRSAGGGAGADAGGGHAGRAGQPAGQPTPDRWGRAHQHPAPPARPADGAQGRGQEAAERAGRRVRGGGPAHR
jgi:ATP-dependent Clp protease ATP-binding subunit ClpA